MKHHRQQCHIINESIRDDDGMRRRPGRVNDDGDDEGDRGERAPEMRIKNNNSTDDSRWRRHSAAVNECVCTPNATNKRDKGERRHNLFTRLLAGSIMLLLLLSSSLLLLMLVFAKSEEKNEWKENDYRSSNVQRRDGDGSRVFFLRGRESENECNNGSGISNYKQRKRTHVWCCCYCCR